MHIELLVKLRRMLVRLEAFGIISHQHIAFSGYPGST